MFDEVLAGYSEFLGSRNLVQSSQVRHYARWVGDFLSFASEERRAGRGRDF
jgi:hypothetical protein